MELSQAQLNSLQSLTVSSGKIRSDNLPVGQEVRVKVAAVNPEKGEVTLKINDTMVTAKTSLQLTPGQTLQLTVAQSSANKVVLQVPPTLFDAITSQKALREALPKQQPITDAIIQLKSLLKNNAAMMIPDKITLLAKNFVSKLPTPAQLSTASGVKKAIQQSGVFLENKLASILSGQPNKSIDGDIKALLLTLKSTLTKEKSDTLALSKQEIKPGAQVTETVKQVQSTPLPINAALIKTMGNTLQPLPLKSSLTNPSPESELIKQTAEKLSASQAASVNTEQLKYKKIIDIRTIEANIAEATKMTENRIPPDKQLTDKQIQQILSNLLGQRKSPQNNTASNLTNRQTIAPLPIPLGGKPAEVNPTSVTFKTAQQYAAKETLSLKNDMALSAIKSQHVSEASAPRINNLMDLIETLIKQVDSAISRTHVHQLNAMQDPETGRLAMSMEIPVNDDDNLHLVQLHIEKEPNKENETETIVTVNLAVDLDAIGPVYARITLISDNTSVVLWAERDSTFHLVQESVETLHSKLESSGLKSESIACHRGQPPQSQFIRPENNNGLLDVRA
ncbi:MAG: flagellar hook-length control protein FliK [Gammaproteobacteria bacterium]|nr:flagellar hook-length control protein FliK [Gammaproteobacteria bacterium]